MKKFVTYLTVGILAGAFLWFISFNMILMNGMERALKDGFFYLREPDAQDLVKEGLRNPYVSDAVQLIAIDDQSLGTLGKWPWYRDVHATYLDTIQQFSPQSVFFDVAFIDPEKIPSSITGRIQENPAVFADVQKAFSSMDASFAAALGRYDNVYIDLFLTGEARPDISYIDRIKETEQVMTAYSHPAPADIPVYYHSLEPLVAEFLHQAQPVTVDQWPDEDEVLRNFNITPHYQTTDGEKRYYFSVLLALLMHYYDIHDKEQVVIESDRIILQAARAPVLGLDKQPKLNTNLDFKALRQQIKVGAPPADYNPNLYNLLVDKYLYLYPGDEKNKPDFPLHLLKKEEGGYELIKGREVYDAAIRMNSVTVDAFFYEEKPIVIKTGMNMKGVPHLLPVNFAGQEEQSYAAVDPESKRESSKTFYTIPTESYINVFNTGQLPELPELATDGTLLLAKHAELLTWFKAFSETKYNEVLIASQKKYEALNLENILKYVKEDPDEGKYFYYKMFFDDLEAMVAEGQFEQAPDLAECISLYPDWLGMKEFQQQKFYNLDEKNIIAALQDLYLGYFNRYYNKVIFTGAYSKGMAEDVKVTPYGNMYGVNVITNAFSTIVTDNQLSYASDSLNITLLFLCCLVFALCYGPVNIRIGAYLFILTFVATFVGSYILFHTNNYMIRTVPLVFANVVIFVSITVLKVLTEEKDKRFLKSTFSQYISPELINMMYENKTMPKLGGSSDIITAYFTDIQSFSTFSEKLTATELVDLLNEYLTAMTDALLEQQGTLDKYEGDAIVAFFGAPMKLKDHAFRACKVAITMQNKLLGLREKWRQEKSGENRNVKNIPPHEWVPGEKWPKIVHDMKMRIGINTGEIVTGNMGSATRMNYTMMGDSVNLAARLEAGSKQYGVYTLISEATYRHEFTDQEKRSCRVSDLVEVRFIDELTVVGKSEPVKVYELIALKGGLSEKEILLNQLFAEGIALYRAMAWDQAIAKFEEALKVERFPEGKTTPSAVYIKRCMEYKANPPVAPGETWDGVYRLTSK